jgi:uncharacterized repeat protein (TIGR03943 family)
MGAVILTVALVGRLASLRSSHEEEVAPRDAIGFAALALPVVVLLALPPASLTSFAAGRRSSFVGAGFVASAADVATGDLSLTDVAGALRSEDAMDALAQRAGEDVTFVGFVNRDPGMPADEFILTRFLISCCVADALSVQVRVAGAPPGELKQDQWVRVEGQLYPLGREVIVDLEELTKVDRPEQPYLSS